MKSIIFICSLITIISSSCSIEKRVYNSGYHISWNSKQKSTKEVTPLSNKEITSIKKIEINDVKIEKTENIIGEKEVVSVNKCKKNPFINKSESSSLVNSIYKSEKKDKSEIKNIEAIKKIVSIKQQKNKKSIELEDLLLKILIIILILILIGVLLSLIGGILGSLLSLLLFILLLYLILKILGVI